MRRIIIILIIIVGIVALMAALAMPNFIKYRERRAEEKYMAYERAMQIRHMQFTGEGVMSNPGDRPNDIAYFKGHGKNPLKYGKVRKTSTLDMAIQINNR